MAPSPSFAQRIFFETVLAQIIGVVGVFSHLQYLQMLTAHTSDGTMSEAARFLKIPLTIAWGLLYIITVLSLLEFYPYGIGLLLLLLAALGILFGALFSVLYMLYLISLAGTFSGIVREAQSRRM